MQRYHRQSRRLRGHDYAGAGWYFITCVTWDRRPILATVRGGRLILTASGRAVEQTWHTIPDHFPGVTLDAFAVMPDHVHGLIHLDDRTWGGRLGGGDPAGASHGSPLHGSPLPPRGPAPRSVGAIVAGWKAAATRQIWRDGPGVPPRIWQRNYHEWVVRNDRWLERVRRYIIQNPATLLATFHSSLLDFKSGDDQ